MPFRTLNGHGDLMMRHQVVDVLNALEPPSQRSAYIAGYIEALKRVATGLGIGYLEPFDPHERDVSLGVTRYDDYP